MAIRQAKQVNEYAKSDIDFSRARSVLRGVYIAVQIILILSLFGMTITAIHENGLAMSMSVVLMLVIMPFLAHLIYSFYVGFFEIVRHLREIRDELVASRTRTGAIAQTPPQAVQTDAAPLRYDAKTHQYVKSL